MATREFSLSDFSSVDVGRAMDVDVRRSDSYSIVVEADWVQLRSVEVSREGETLRVRRQWHPLAWIPVGTRPEVRITMPVLRGLSIHGACRGTVGGFSSSEDFRMELSGASTVRGDLGVGNATLVVSGASRVGLSGSAGDLTADISGASHAELGAFTAKDVDARLTGASGATVYAGGRLNARLGGASTLRWKGEPVMGDIKVRGASSLHKEG